MSTPDFASVVRSLISAEMSGVNVALPGVVTNYNAATQRADVQPAIKLGYIDEEGDRQTENLPVVTDCPVVFPGAGSFSMTWPIASGDEVLLVFASASIDRWLSSGGVIDPGDDRKHHLSDAVAIAGLRHSALTPTAVSATATVLKAPVIQFGSNAAVDGVLKGTTFLAQLNTLVAAIAAGVGTITSGAPSGGAPAATAITTALAAFNATVATYLSSKVFTE